MQVRERACSRRLSQLLSRENGKKIKAGQGSAERDERWRAGLSRGWAIQGKQAPAAETKRGGKRFTV